MCSAFTLSTHAARSTSVARYDKLAERYEATITVTDIFIWLRAGPGQPRGDP